MDQFPVVLIAVIIILIWVFNSLNVLREYERGVIFRIGRLMAEPKGPGLIWVIWPIDRIVRKICNARWLARPRLSAKSAPRSFMRRENLRHPECWRMRPPLSRSSL